MPDVFTQAKRSEVMSRIRGGAQNPKSCGVRPDCRMMERVVPMGSSYFGCGTMAMRPAAFLYLAWLPRWVTKPKPCYWSTRMTTRSSMRVKPP